MYADEIKNILLKTLPLKEVYVYVYDNHYDIIAVGQIFVGKSKLDQHKMIYGPITKFITEYTIHSISIHAFSPKEWNIQRQLYENRLNN